MSKVCPPNAAKKVGVLGCRRHGDWGGMESGTVALALAIVPEVFNLGRCRSDFTQVMATLSAPHLLHPPRY